ncbi:MAG: MFS transporter [Candidatus Omnitrophota bacterium]|nr:MFS transporter [Candidatus Omnitrophota bacterium]
MAKLTPDGRLLFLTRILRLFGYGAVSVILVIYLASLGLSQQQIGWLLALTLIGDAVISLGISLIADSVGRRRMLRVGALLMMFAGILFAFTDNFVFLLLAAIVGVISPSGNEVGPFLAIEQASLSDIVADDKRTGVFAWYNLAGFGATALGALSVGALFKILTAVGISPLVGYKIILVIYALTGLALWFLFGRVSNKVEVSSIPPSLNLASLVNSRLGIHQSRAMVLRLSALFALDAFGGGFILQSLLAYWFHVRFGADMMVLGGIFFGANLLAGISSLLAVRLAKRFGLINTMVFTHLPSNVLLILMVFMPNLTWAAVVFLLRCTISQMDVPTRQAYVMAVVTPSERSAAGGIANVARTLGTSAAPLLAGPLLANPALVSVPIILAGGLKIVYDLLLFRDFRKIKPPEELRDKL